jgi:hypothetical protein
MSFPLALASYLKRVGQEFDIAFSVLTGGPLGWTFSKRSAYGAGWRPTTNRRIASQKGPRRWQWCVVCRLLNFVQENHCALQFTDIPSPPRVYLKAGLAFSALGTVLYTVFHAIRWALLTLF